MYKAIVNLILYSITAYNYIKKIIKRFKKPCWHDYLTFFDKDNKVFLGCVKCGKQKKLFKKCTRPDCNLCPYNLSYSRSGVICQLGFK